MKKIISVILLFLSLSSVAQLPLILNESLIGLNTKELHYAIKNQRYNLSYDDRTVTLIAKSSVDDNGDSCALFLKAYSFAYIDYENICNKFTMMWVGNYEKQQAHVDSIPLSSKFQKTKYGYMTIVNGAFVTLIYKFEKIKKSKNKKLTIWIMASSTDATIIKHYRKKLNDDNRYNSK